MVSTFAFVFSSGLRTRIGDLKYFGSRKGLLLKSLLSVDILVPLITIALIILIRPPKATAIGLLLLASSPASPTVLKNITKASGKTEYAMSLNIVLASLAILTTPATLAILSSVSELQIGISPLAVAGPVGLSILMPITAGIAIRWLFPALAEYIIQPMEILSNVLLILVFVLVLLFTYRLLLMFDIRSYLVIALMTIGSMVSGHLLASRLPDEQTTLAIESASRNTGLALLIVSDFASLGQAMPVLIPYLITSAVIGFFYVRYRKMKRAAANSAVSD